MQQTDLTLGIKMRLMMLFLELTALPEVCLASGLSARLKTKIWISFSCHLQSQC